MKYVIHDPSKAEQHAFLRALYDNALEGLLEYTSQTVLGNGLMIKVQLDLDKALGIINSKLAEYNIPAADEGIIQLVKDMGQMGYYDHQSKEVKYVLWYPGVENMSTVNQILQEVMMTCADHPTPTVKDITWDVGVSQYIPRDLISEYKLHPFTRSRKTQRVMERKFAAWEGVGNPPAIMENATLIMALNSGKVQRHIRRTL